MIKNRLYSLSQLSNIRPLGERFKKDFWHKAFYLEEWDIIHRAWKNDLPFPFENSISLDDFINTKHKRDDFYLTAIFMQHFKGTPFPAKVWNDLWINFKNRTFTVDEYYDYLDEINKLSFGPTFKEEFKEGLLTCQEWEELYNSWEGIPANDIML